MHDKTETVTVLTYSGYKADEYPRRFLLNGQWHDIIETEDRWYSPGYAYFKVFASDAHRYMLKLDIETHSWTVQRL